LQKSLSISTNSIKNWSLIARRQLFLMCRDNFIVGRRYEGTITMVLYINKKWKVLS
jgi:hypothetical protein